MTSVLKLDLADSGQTILPFAMFFDTVLGLVWQTSGYKRYITEYSYQVQSVHRRLPLLGGKSRTAAAVLYQVRVLYEKDSFTSTKCLQL